MALLFDLHQIQHGILIVVTHNMELAQNFSLKYKLTDTRLHRV